MFGNTSIDTALGIKPSGKTLFKGATTKLGKVVQDAISEGVEEGVAELVNPLTKMTYKGTESLKEYGDGEFWKGVGESALVGAATSAAFCLVGLIHLNGLIKAIIISSVRIQYYLTTLTLRIPSLDSISFAISTAFASLISIREYAYSPRL